MFESDKAIGQTYNDAIRFIEAFDLWDEVIDLQADIHGIVIKVIH